MPSQVIRDFRYDLARHELTVSFMTGRVYVYALVPPAVAGAFVEAVSPGAFFNTRIRDRFPFRRGRPQAASSAEKNSLRDALRRSREG